MSINYRRDLWKIIPVSGGRAAEIGVAEGFFSAEMLSWPVNFEKVYMVDRWRCVPSQRGDASNSQEWHDKNYADAMARVAKFGERAVPLRGDSAQMSLLVKPGTLHFINVDGDHTEDGVISDIVHWLPKLVKGGIMAFHDYEAPQYGVKRAVTKFAHANNLDIHLLCEDKPEDAGAYIIIP